MVKTSMLAMLSFLLLHGVCSADQEIPITTLDLNAVEQGWGKPAVDRSVDGHPIAIAGRKFDHGFGTHSPGLFLIDLSKGSSRFHAWVGIDDETNRRGSVEFQVIGDGRMLWSSGVMHGGDGAKEVNVDLSGVKNLGLLVGDAGDGFEFDHADWAEAALTVNGALPHSQKPSPSNPTIAEPNSSALPTLTSPLISSARPGTPFQYAITCISSSPNHYVAHRLPSWLRLNPETGLIVGNVPSAIVSSDIHITVGVKNAIGLIEQGVTLRVGGRSALTPPLGWNSYDCFGDDVTEQEVIANAEYLQKYLHPHGWEYVIVDYRWYDPNAATNPNDANIHQGKGLTMDRFGRLLPSPNRFPTATEGRGFRPLSDRIHAMGLKFGIHVMRGITREAVVENTPIEGSSFKAADAGITSNTCPWCSDMYGVDASKPAGQAWYDSLLRLYASWGVDYIKVDDMSSPYSTVEIEAVHRAIQKCGRAIVLSLSPGDTPVEQAAHVGENANLWRISGDFWDNWGSVNHQFELLRRWAGNGGPGHWPDADMIPLGHVSVSGRSVGPDRHSGLNLSLIHI